MKMQPEQSIRVLYVADARAQATARADQLEQCDARFAVDVVDGETAETRIATQRVDCAVIGDVDTDRARVIETLRKSDSSLPIVLRVDDLQTVDSGISDSIDAGVIGIVPGAIDDREQLLAARISDAVVARRASRGRERRQLERLQEMTRELMDTPAAAIPEQAVSFARGVLDLPVTALALQRDGTLTVVAATNEAEDLFGRIPSFNDGDGLAQRAFERGEPTILADARDHPDVADPETPVRSVGIFPLSEHGVLITGSTERGVLDETDANFGRLLAASVESALDRAERERHLERQNERLEEFASVVSHDLRNPLNVAQGHLKLLEERYDDESLDRIAEAHDRMEELIEGVLALARQGEMVGETDLTDVANVAEEAWSTVGATEAQLELHDPRVVAADPGRLRQLLENLFRNAVEHAGPEVTVTVGSVADGGFYVADDGPGVDEPERAFERGYSGSERGSGFGLAIVREIAAAHGWTVDVTECGTGGARFEIVPKENVTVNAGDQPNADCRSQRL